MAMKKAGEILQMCERELQAVLQRCAKSGDYSAVGDLARWAGRVADLAAEAAAAARPRPSQSIAVRLKAADGFADTGGPGLLKADGPTSTKRSKKDLYPKFGKRGDQLVKIGWSRREKKEYQHKSPRHIADLLRVALAGVGRNAKVVTTERLFPLKEQDGSEVPSYQAYLCLAWLRHEELVAQQGRQGYRVPSPTSLAESIEKRWASLPQL